MTTNTNQTPITSDAVAFDPFDSVRRAIGWGFECTYVSADGCWLIVEDSDGGKIEVAIPDGAEIMTQLLILSRGDITPLYASCTDAWFASKWRDQKFQSISVGS